jgi:hypothetical protein
MLGHCKIPSKFQSLFSRLISAGATWSFPFKMDNSGTPSAPPQCSTAFAESERDGRAEADGIARCLAEPFPAGRDAYFYVVVNFLPEDAVGGATGIGGNAYLTSAVDNGDFRACSPYPRVGQARVYFRFHKQPRAAAVNKRALICHSCGTRGVLCRFTLAQMGVGTVRVIFSFARICFKSEANRRAELLTKCQRLC